MPKQFIIVHLDKTIQGFDTLTEAQKALSDYRSANLALYQLIQPAPQMEIIEMTRKQWRDARLNNQGFSHGEERFYLTREGDLPRKVKIIE